MWPQTGGPSYTGRNRNAREGGPTGVGTTYASALREHEALFATYEHLQGLPRGDSALTLLRKVASMVKPIMRKRNWTVRVLAEFLPKEANLLGLNINRGQKICLRLRYHNNPDLFLPIEQVVDTMLHELSHNVWGEHDGNFHRLWDELRNEHETLLMKGFTGEGFLGRGQRLGGRYDVPAPQDMRRLARASAEQRQVRLGTAAGSGQRLGGSALHNGQDIREVIAGQALLRTTVNRGCGSVRTDAGVLANSQQMFRTNGQDDDDANNRAIAEALIDLMEAEEAAKLNGTFRNVDQDEGLAWSKEHGLYDPKSPLPPHLPHDFPDLPSEEDQMRWAIEESKRLGPPTSDNDFGGLPPESLVSPISPMSFENSTRGRASSLASRLRQDSVTEVSPLGAPSPTLVRTQPPPSTAPGTTTLAPIIDLSEPFNPDEWACEVCTCVNPMQFLACDACGVERSKKHAVPGKRSAAKPSHSSSALRNVGIGVQPSRQQGIGWLCPRCHSFMEHKWWTCSACGLMKTSS